MRIVPLVVFCIATYVAKVADGGETIRTTSENGIKHIFRQKSEAERDEILVDDKVTPETKRRRRQSLLINRFDGLSRSRKIINKLEGIKRRRKKRAKDITSNQNAFKNNDIDKDVDEEKDTLSKTRELPIWQVSEPTIATIDLNSAINSTIVRTEMINRTMFMTPQSRNLNSYRSSNKAISKFQNSKYVRSPVFEKLINKIPLSVYLPKTPIDVDLSNSKSTQRFEWRENSLNIKQDSPKDDHLTKDSNERFLLVPVSKDLYILKNIKDNSETIIPNRSKLLGRNKIEENTTSAIISFKAHMHHDVKDVGRAYLHHRDSNNNHRLFDTDYLYTDLDSGVLEENTESVSSSLSYPNFLYPGVAFQTRPDLNDAVPKIFDQQVTLSVPDYKYISSENMASDAEVIPYNSFIFPLTSPSFDTPNYDVSSYLKEDDRLTFPNTDHFFFNNAENILNNLDRNENNMKSGTSISSEFTDEKSTYSNDFNYNKFIDEILFNNYTMKLDSFLNVEDYTTSSLLLSVTNEWSLKKEQSNVGNPRALLKAIEPLSSELTKLLSAVKLVNQSISDVQNGLCDKKNVIRSARIERDSKERKTTNIAELINSKDDFDLFIGSSDDQSLDKKQIKIIENITDRMNNDVEFKRKFNDYFLNKLTTPLHKRGSSSSSDRKMRNNHRNLKLNEFADKVKDNKINFLLNKKRELTTRYSGTSKLSSDKEKKYSSVDPQSHFFREATAYLDILRLLDMTKKPYVELTNIVTESLISTTEFFGITILPYPIERSITTTMETSTTKEKIGYEVVEAISLTQLSVTLSAFTITMPTTPSQFYTTELPIFPINEILQIEKTTLAVAMLTEVTETSTVKLTTKSAMLLTSFLEGITNITLRITVPAITLTTLIEEAFTTEEEIVESTSTMKVMQSFPAETSISLYITLTVPSFITAETAESIIQATTPTIPVLTSLIVTKQPRITIPIEEATSVTEKMVTVISPTIMITKSTVILDENTTLYKAITSASTAKITEASLAAGEIKMTSIESTTITEYITLPTTQFVSTAQITKGTTKTSITSTITAITSSPTISERTETILSTSTEITIITLIPETESPVTQIEKTITTEEITMATPTIIETPMTTKISIISDTSMFNETLTSPTTTEVSPTKRTETVLTTIKATITKILTPSGISTIINTLSFKLRTTIKSSTTTEISTLIESPTTTEILTTIKTSIIPETIESTSISITVTTAKTFPTTLLITTKSATTSGKITVLPTILTTLKLTTPLFLVTNTTLSETPCTFLTEEIETTTSSITSTISSIKPTTISTIKLTAISTIKPTTIFTIKTKPTTLSILMTTMTFLNTSVTINKTLFTTIFTTFKTATIETATFPMSPVITTSPFDVTQETTLIPSIVGTNTTLSEITFNTSLIEMTEELTLTTISLTEIVSTTSLVESITEELIATWITTEETIITEATTLMTYVPLSTTMFSIEITTETTLFEMETVSAISSEEISTIAKVTAVSFTTITEESSLIKEITTSVTSLPITEKLEQITILKSDMTFNSLSEFTLSILITTETSATMPEVISVLSETISEEREFTTKLTSPSITFTLESSTLFTERRIQPTISTLTAITTEMPEAETEYYVAKEPFYEEYEEYEKYDTEIPTDNWYYYEEYETTVKSKTTTTSSTVKYTKLPKETATSSSFDKGTTSSYEIKTSKFTMYSTTSISTHTDVILTTTTAKIPYTFVEEKFTITSILKTSAKIIENVTTTEVETMFTTSMTSKEEESTTIMTLTFGSTEEYTLLPSTVFEIITKPLEYLTIPAKYTEPTSKFLTQIWYSVTAPEEISTLQKISTEIEFTSVEKLISFFVSSTLTTLSEREAIGVTTSEIKTATEVITLATKLITKEETTPYTTTVPEIETEFITRRTTIRREEQRKQLLQLLKDLKQREREVAEREERLKEKERQWEKKKHEEIMHREREKTKNITIVSGTTASYVTVTVSPTVEIKITSFLLETSSLAEIITTFIKTTPLYITEEGIFATNITEWTEETTEESTSVFSIYMAEVTEETAILYTTEESTSVVDLYNVSLVSIETTTEEMYTTSYKTAYLSEPLFTLPTMVFTSPITLAIDEFTTLPTATFTSSYKMGVTSIAIPVITKERYTTSYVTLCSAFPFTTMTTLISLITPTIGITSPISSTTSISYITEKTVDIYSESSVTSLAFIETTTAIAIKEMEYDEEIESLKEELRKKERELEKREQMLLEREKQLENNIMEFELYMKKVKEEETLRTLIALSEKPIVPTSLSTLVPPTEKIQVATQIEKVTDQKENQTTTKMVTSPYKATKVKDIKEEKRTRYVPEKVVTQKMEEEIVTKRICLNVLENTTIPFVAKKVCLSYFPEKNREQKSVGRVNRKLLSLKNTREIRKLKFRNFSSNFRYKRARGEIGTTRKIDNLQLSHHEWLSNGITKPMRHFKGFTRIYGKKENISPINTEEDSIHNFRGKTSLYEQRILDPYENNFPKTFTLVKKYRKRMAYFIEHNLISARRNNFSNNNGKCIEKRNVLPAEKNTASVSNQKATSAIIEEEKLGEKEDEFYTVNVLHLSYNKDRETHEVISAKPNKDELAMIISESNDDSDVTKFEEDDKIATSYYEEKNNLQEGNDLQEEEKSAEDESFEDMFESIINRALFEYH